MFGGYKVPIPEIFAVKVTVSHNGMGPLLNGMFCAAVWEVLMKMESNRVMVNRRVLFMFIVRWIAG